MQLVLFLFSSHVMLTGLQDIRYQVFRVKVH